MQGACLWGTICNASAGMGRAVTEGYGEFAVGDLRAAGFEDPQTARICATCRWPSACAPAATSTCPIGWKNICRSNEIKTVNTGGFGARLKALLDGEVEAASLLPPQIAMAEQLGLRKIIEDRFKTRVVGARKRAARGRARLHARAQSRRTGAGSEPRQISAVMEARRPGGIRDLPSVGLHQVRPRRTLHQQAAARQEFDEVFAQVERWGLDQYLKDRDPETLSYSA